MLNIHRTELNGHPFRGSREGWLSEATAFPSVGADLPYGNDLIPPTQEAISAYALNFPLEPTAAPAAPSYTYTRGELQADLVTYEATFDIADQADAEYFIVKSKLNGGDYVPILPLRTPGKITVYLSLNTEYVNVTAVNGLGETWGVQTLF